MRCITPLARIVCLSTALVALPSWVAAQHTITGRLVEQAPGGTSLPAPVVYLDSVSADGSSLFLGGISRCLGGATVDCIAADGAFNITSLASGAYLLSVEDNDVPVLDKIISVNVSSNVNVGTIQLIRTPFKVEVSVGTVPSTGGQIPVTVRVTTTWNIPTTPITAKIEERQTTTADGFTRSAVPLLVDFVWPSGFADSGPVSLSPLSVAADDPAGGYHCVDVTLLQQGNRKRTLGHTIACSGKRP